MKAQLIVNNSTVASLGFPPEQWPREIQSPVAFSKLAGRVEISDDADKLILTIYPDSHVCAGDYITIGGPEGFTVSHA